jgi:predicted dehydrogenase
MTDNSNVRRLRLGLVGGGIGSFIGEVHRAAARLDDRFVLVAGALSSDPAKSRRSAAACRIAADRAYSDYQAMADAEAGRDDGVEVVAILTPNAHHFRPALAFVERGVHVICEKPLTTRSDEAFELLAAIRRTGVVFTVAHAYTGYPLVREARALVRAGTLGTIRLVETEYAQGTLATPLENTGHAIAMRRTDPAQNGEAGCLNAIGTHAFNLAHFVTGLEPSAVCADLTAFVAGRRVPDTAHVLLRYAGGARGSIWVTQVAVGHENSLRLRVVGEKAALTWSQEEPNALRLLLAGEPARVLTRGSPALTVDGARGTRLPQGHPEGFLEAFANLYASTAEQILALADSRPPSPEALDAPTAAEAARAVAFVDAAMLSHRNGGSWTAVSTSM